MIHSTLGAYDTLQLETRSPIAGPGTALHNVKNIFLELQDFHKYRISYVYVSTDDNQ